MEWIVFLIIVVGFGMIFLSLKRLGSLNPDLARQYLKAGAKVLDVRSAEEFQARHLPGAINLPAGDVAQQIVRLAPDKNTILLLHCLSGGRSGMATRTLRGLGYTNAFNLGSYAQAEKILNSTQA